MKIALGLLLGFLIGALCRFADIPVPAPPALVGALLVLAMTTGYVLMNRWASHRVAHHRELCGGPNGRPITRSDA
jgi:XapX domain-containing protein